MSFESKRPVRPFVTALTCFLALSLLILPFFGASTAQAAGGLDIGTPFPGVTVKAGENVSFELTVTDSGTEPMNVALSVAEIPDGWEGYFEGNGSQVSRVYATPGAETPAKVTFRTTVPENTPDGNYKIKLSGNAGVGITSTLELDLNVSEVEMTSGEFTSQFPELQGPATATFPFKVMLANNSGEEQSYSLSAQAPEGWQVTFSPSGGTDQIASVSVESGRNQGLDVKVTPPPTVTEGEYVIPCVAASANESLTTDLKVSITGTYSMSIATTTGNMAVDAQANQKTPVTLNITNTGSAELTNINLTSKAPEGWSIEFGENSSSIPSLESGATAEVVAYIQPSEQAIAGDYAASITASNDITKSQIDLRVAVQTSTLWGVVGIVIIVVLVVVLVVIFGKFGRR